MEMGVMNAIPIWDMLGISEEQYELDYQYEAFVENGKFITELVKGVSMLP
jgi:hypothetical protein